MTLILGLTGSIGMGKSTAARLLRAQGVPVFQADQYVHRLLNKGGIAVGAVARAFPAAYDKKGQKIDRVRLGRVVFQNPSARKILEDILHPLVRKAEERFIRIWRARVVRVAVLDIPLLYETRADVLCDAVLVVSAPASVQRARVLARKGMTPEKLKTIRTAQMSDAQKRARADAVLNTDQPLAATNRDLQKILRALQKTHARNHSGYRNHGA